MRTQIHRKDAGFAALAAELVSVAIMMVIMTAMIPSILRMQEISNQNQAIAQLRIVSNALATINTCALQSGCNSAAILPLIPVNNFSVMQSGYSYLFSQNGNAWAYTAQPQAPGSSGLYYFYVDQTAVLRCEQGRVANALSPACN